MSLRELALLWCDIDTELDLLPAVELEVELEARREAEEDGEEESSSCAGGGGAQHISKGCSRAGFTGGVNDERCERCGEQRSWRSLNLAGLRLGMS